MNEVIGKKKNDAEMTYAMGDCDECRAGLTGYNRTDAAIKHHRLYDIIGVVGMISFPLLVAMLFWWNLYGYFVEHPVQIAMAIVFGLLVAILGSWRRK